MGRIPCAKMLSHRTSSLHRILQYQVSLQPPSEAAVPLLRSCLVLVLNGSGEVSSKTKNLENLNDIFLI